MQAVEFQRGMFVCFSWGKHGIRVGCLLAKRQRAGVLYFVVGVMPEDENEASIITEVEVEPSKLDSWFLPDGLVLQSTGKLWPHHRNKGAA